MNILVVDNHTKYLTKIKENLGDYNYSICSKEDFTPNATNNFELIIFTGGSKVRSVKNHREDYESEINFIKNSNKKIIGICLGCEIIAAAFDCVLSESITTHKGKYPINFRDRTITVYEAHRFGISNISDDIEVVATSDYGIEIIKHKTKPIYGIQFHPEVAVENSDNILLEIIREI